ncbi:hypothetical protein [Halosimplex pelagicum]|uniref:Uncharacterized protein n=1 Tax=Halosimplex pelagicum TaxID=869886 RepID=A0A7D5TBF6_9EURY|nr:hypothetical protein [Halosimplex pelagicum]QLH82233.1 hypothetical protein HZS54_11710 [Halosimplex pelagicum]
MPTADGRPSGTGGSLGAVEIDGDVVSEIKRMSSEYADLNWHADPLVTKQLAAVTDDIKQHEQTTIFSNGLETFQDNIKAVHTPPKHDNSRLNDWFAVFAFNLEEDKLVTLQEADADVEGDSLPESAISDDLITEFTTPLVWAPWFGKQKRVFHYDPEFATYDYHLPIGKHVFTRNETNPLQITSSEFASFVNRFLTRKYNLQMQPSESAQKRGEIYTSIFLYPLAEALHIHENYEG